MIRVVFGSTVAWLGVAAESGMLGFFWVWRVPGWHLAAFIALWCVANACRKAETLRQAVQP